MAPCIGAPQFAQNLPVATAPHEGQVVAATEEADAGGMGGLEGVGVVIGREI
jgi:hypothetical protein